MASNNLGSPAATSRSPVWEEFRRRSEGEAQCHECKVGYVVFEKLLLTY